MTYLLGLTGGIASGKSTVTQMFRSKNIPVIDADIIAREVVKPGKPGLEKIVSHFGKDVLLEDGTLDRKKLGTIIFNDDAKRALLNHILSDEIRTRILEMIELCKKSDPSLIVLDIPLLYEGGYDEIVDDVMVCYVPRDIQLKRLMARDHLKENDAIKRIDSQMSLEEKKSRADVVIDNSGRIDETLKQVQTWFDTIIKEKSPE